MAIHVHVNYISPPGVIMFHSRVCDLDSSIIIMHIDDIDKRN